MGYFDKSNKSSIRDNNDELMRVFERHQKRFDNLMEKEKLKDEPCPCQSGKRFKDCHGSKDD